MSNPEPMDQWLREAMAAPEPQLSPQFDADLARTLRTRHLDRSGRLVMAAYVAAALALTAWSLRTVPIEGLVWVLPILAGAASASLYARHLVRTS